jgi:iron complex transport system substrate-binding protein
MRCFSMSYFLSFQRLRYSSLFPYFIFSFFIAGWWLLAFQKAAEPTWIAHDVSQSLGLKTADLLNELSPLQRHALKDALAGNFKQMLEFIDQWEDDAFRLKAQGIQDIRHLSQDQFQQAHLIGHLLNLASAEALRQLNYRINLNQIIDDQGRPFKIENNLSRFIPQTYLSASFLLAIAQPSEIIGLPKGFRHETSLYSPELFKLIPDDLDQLSGEKLFLRKPQLAFIAPYSHPASLEALHKQNIHLYSIKHIDTIAQIQEALLKIGHASNHILEAQLLAIFMEASFLALDNRLLALRHSQKSMQTLLFLSQRQHYVQPTTKCLSGQLVARALKLSAPHIQAIPENQNSWSLPIDQESILQANPDCLIVSTCASPAAPSQSNVCWSETKAGQSNQIYYVDESIQESPTQYIALAYFDVYQAFSHFYSR